MQNNRQSCWPTAQQELLLKACLLDRSQALKAFNEWKIRVDVVHDPLDSGTFRLLPLLYRQLIHHDIDDKLLPILKGIHRQTWYKNQFLFSLAKRVMAALENENIPTMLLKGAALAHTCYQDPAARPMDDIDLLIPFEKAEKSIQILKNFGLKTQSPSLACDLRTRHAASFQATDILAIDLHWHVMLECVAPRDDADFWQDAIDFDFMGQPAQTLCPADQLLHQCAHGSRWSPMPSIRWIADSIMLINASGQKIDWDRFVRQAQQRRLTVVMQKALEYLTTAFGAEIPCKPIAQLAKSHPEYLERIEYAFITTDQAKSPLGILPLIVFRFLRNTRHKNWPAKFFGLPKFLQDVFYLKSTWELIFVLFAKTLRRTKLYVIARNAKRFEA